ncbi:STAS domain-containing protein [Opitutus terrae]|uniref:Uncharacterized protein n=1 Tax=Opitutus terrae (strain DSM 11246 / JCM 15787 / PB90-1) TaxID=452637 RepID=B1ZYW5_OPITP|nr:STAS domain-containing protein [Opitutus terrae]ACB76288.1 hypothetical protein Oter_3007 [Opitutus terrae PB90-1]
MHLTLPEIVNADGLLPFLTLIGAEADDREVVIDFSALRRVSPAALAALSSRVAAWRLRGIVIQAVGLERCSILGYLQRMDVLAVCGFNLPEMFSRHDARGRFVPVRVIDHRVQEMGSEMALCVAPGGDDWEHPLAGLYDLVWYVLTEMGNNVRQHSGGAGFACAQVGAAEGLVRLAIADNGRGIRQSFRDAGLPWAAALDDTGAILKALEPRISSKGSPTNEGVGLTLTAKMAELASAWLLVASGRGVVRWNPDSARPQAGTLRDGGSYPGTLIAVTFRQDRVRDFAQLLDQAKRASGLLRPGQGRAKFDT